MSAIQAGRAAWFVPIGLAVAVIAAGGCGGGRSPEGTPGTRTFTPPTATATIDPNSVTVSASRSVATLAIATETPVSTIPAALDPEGPWLLGIGGEDRLVALNPDGSGLTHLAHEPLWDSYPEVREGVELSGTGWIAVRTSANGWPVPPTDMSLDLFQLPDVQPVRRIPLFSQELVARMGQIGEHRLPYEAEPVEGPNWRYEMVYLVILSERNPPRWSPDGRYLAFAAAMDGPSSDLYVYDTQTDQVRRLTDGPNQAAIMGWSPDSRWIIHVEASTYMIADGGEIGGFPGDAVWAAAVDGSELKRLYEPARVEWILGWVADTVFLVEGWSGYIFLHDLRSVDVATGAEQMHYLGKYYNSALAPEPGVAVVDAVSDWRSEEEYLPGGLHLVPLDGGEPKQLRTGVQEFNARWLQWFPQLDRFFAGGFGSPYLFTSSGEITHTFEDERGWPAVSPDGSWLIFDEERERPGLRLYRSDGQLDRVISEENAFNFVWLPDSSGLYYLVQAGDSNRLMVVSIPEAETVVLHPNPGLYRFVLVGRPKESG